MGALSVLNIRAKLAGSIPTSSLFGSVGSASHMRTVRSTIVPAIIIGAIGCAICAVALAARIISFQPARAIFAGDVPFPPNSVAEGVVVLSVVVDAHGRAEETEVWRDVPSLTHLAETSLVSWLFQPASRGTSAVASTTTVAFVFRPPVSITTRPSFQPVLARKTAVSQASGYVSPGIISVAYPDYPPNTVVSDTIVLKVGVDRLGNPAIIGVIRGGPPLSASAVEAAKKWKFQAATLDGKPVVSIMPIAFIFRNPNSSTVRY